jgi:hypothetical protein
MTAAFLGCDHSHVDYGYCWRLGLRRRCTEYCNGCGAMRTRRVWTHWVGWRWGAWVIMPVVLRRFAP